VLTRLSEWTPFLVGVLNLSAEAYTCVGSCAHSTVIRAGVFCGFSILGLCLVDVFLFSVFGIRFSVMFGYCYFLLVFCCVSYVSYVRVSS
jgi:hypothetical protein